MVLRQRDANSGWTSAADGVMEERRYSCQNWRGDLSAILTSAGAMVEWAKYSAYGIPFGLPAADTDSDGDTDSADVTAIQAWAATYDVRADVDLDGDIDGTDGTLASSYSGTTSGWNVLSASVVANRIGYAGYQQDVNLDHYHVRNRVYSPELGRWTRRDPLGYVDGMSLYEYVGSMSLINGDSTGLASGRGHIYADNPLTNTRSNPNKCGNYGLFGASCNACCYAQYPDSLDPAWLAACLGNCKGITPPAPGRVYPGTAGSPCEEICLRGGGHGASACWNGIKYSCNCAIQVWGGIPGTKDSPKYDFSRCIDECEGLHQPNYTCPPETPGGGYQDPIWNGGMCGKSCSECNVYTCLTGCMSRTMNCERYEVEHWRQECRDMKRYIETDKWLFCSECFQCVSQW